LRCSCVNHAEHNATGIMMPVSWPRFHLVQNSQVPADPAESLFLRLGLNFKCVVES
jgi:hypothetical protein